jgi:uncharacterized membrane protein/glutaredoxin
MVRQRSDPFPYRYTRPLMAGLATLGAVITAYLTVAKLTNTPTLCPTEGCSIVMASPYASLLGIPLALVGFLAYVGIVGLAIAPMLVHSPQQKALHTQLEEGTQLLLLVGATAMLVFSSFLLYLLAFEIQAICIYCVSSAILSVSLFTLAIKGQRWPDLGQPFFVGFLVAVISLVGTLGLYANTNAGTVTDNSYIAGETGLPVTTKSSAAEIALADHLNQIGAKLYGTFWCPYCHKQKQLFGQEAVSRLNYIECDPQGQNPQVELCQSAGLQGYPTWEINGQLIPGLVSLEQLADLSGYQGSRQFINHL